MMTRFLELKLKKVHPCLLTLLVPASVETGVGVASLFFVVIIEVMFSVFELINFVIFSVLELINFINPSKWYNMSATS